MSSITDIQKTQILYNKNLGVATSGPEIKFAALPSTNASTKIFPDLQILSNKIPVKAPTDLVRDTSFSQTSNTTCNRYYSKTYPWIVKYTNYQLTTEQYRLSYNGIFTGNHPLNNINLLY